MKNYKSKDMINAYNIAGYREKFAMDNGNKSIIYANNHKCFKFTYSKHLEYQDANGSIFDTVSKTWIA